MKHPRYEDFAFKGEIDEVAVNKLVEARRVLYVPTGAGSDEFSQELPVYATIPEGAEDEDPFVRMPPWSDDFGRPEGAAADALIALATNRPVLSPNAPGVDFSEWRRAAVEGVSHLMTPDQLEDVRKKGSFKKVGGAVMHALIGASKELKLSGDLRLLASSMAVGIAAGALNTAREEGVEVGGVALSEGVNYINRPLGKLALQFIAQNRFAAGYLKQNPDVIPGEKAGHWLKRTIEAWPANGSYVRALARAGFVADLGNVGWLNEQNTRFFVSRGTASALADEKGHQEITEYLWKAGVKADFKEYAGHDHGYTMTVQSMIDAAKEIA